MTPVPAHPSKQAPGGMVNCGTPGPKMLYRSLLDSGATYPSLYPRDFRELGVYPHDYPAQSLTNLMTANGEVMEWVYELHVELTTENGRSLVDPSDPVNPDFPPYIGGLSPVIMISGFDSPPLDVNGLEENNRLSGIMPFLAAYVSSTPGKNIILFGENRNDVMGAHKTPPCRRWLVGLPQDPTDRAEWRNFGDPMIKFTHRKGLLIDEDTGPGASKMTVFSSPGGNGFSHIFNPREDFRRRRAAGQQGGTIDPSGF